VPTFSNPAAHNHFKAAARSVCKVHLLDAPLCSRLGRTPGPIRILFHRSRISSASWSPDCLSNRGSVLAWSKIDRWSYRVVRFGSTVSASNARKYSP
jgi:hypothetical protein